MIIFFFMHLADAVAVRNSFMQVIQILDQYWQIEYDLTEYLFDVVRVWLEVFYEEQENSWLVLCVTWWATTWLAFLLVFP